MESRVRFCNKTAQITAKTSTSLQLSVSDTLTHVNFPTFAVADPRYGGLIRMTSDCHHLSQIRKGTIEIKQTNLL